MSMPMPTEGRATLAHNYRNLSEREIRVRLVGPMSEAERVTAQAELLRRHAGDNGPDTTLATGFAPSSTFDVVAPDAGAAAPGGVASAPVRAWPWVMLVMAATLATLGWAIHAKLVHF